KTIIEHLNEDDDMMPVKFTYTKFTDMANYMDDKNKSVDKLGVVIDAFEKKTITKNSKESIVQKFVLINEQCRFDLDISDSTGILPASIFGDLAEQLLTFNAVEAMEHFNKNVELPLESLHKELKTKTFLAHIKPIQTQSASVRADANADSSITDQTQTMELITSGEGTSKSKVRLCLMDKFGEAKNAENIGCDGKNDDSAKRTKLG
ncbi:hypothetical protein RJ641_015239, partial [Dillenia turbinata]